ncbi:hypothetical protein BI312_14945 [Xanthomonas citri pv. citri]|nr:hypothetical protein BI314_00010 [Xanthomonas citri pv. citri]AZB52675.1 hypothetical protein BHE84_23090 [Xanthomonas citri pv. glycines str. 8ra]QDR47404.1 hypothetical protein FPK90_01730 [Xanthomonas citri pv. glycines]QYF43078.1 hypothetical protein HZS93_00323 [Xanthomonas citri]APR17653.1 hypothetical protein BI315_14890 [Xanthomonas citri pv. citri]
MARRDKACAAAQAWPPGQGAQRGLGAPQGASRRVGGQRRRVRAARLGLAPAKPAPRSIRSAPLTANASHLNVHNTL